MISSAPPWRLAIMLLLTAALATGCASSGAPESEAGMTSTVSRSFGDLINDQRLRNRIQGYVLQDEDLLHESNVTVTVFNHVVLLTGEVVDAEAGRRLATHAREQNDARVVYNELVIAPLSSVMSRSRDRMIRNSAQSRIRRLEAPETLDPDRVRVIVERQRAYLLGRTSREEAEAITETVRRISGVREVVRMFEYTD
jgi:osmotically-inducible protein OsmY